MRVKYDENRGKLNTAWTIADLASASDLQGKWTKASDYSIQFPAKKTGEITLTWKPDNPELRDPRWLVMRISHLASDDYTVENVDPPK